jgi:hypothetical protein
MMYLQKHDVGFDPAFPNVLVPLRLDCGRERIASLKVKRPISGKDQANWVVGNGANKSGGLQSEWEDNDRFFKYVKAARDRTWNGDAVRRAFTIKEEGRSGLWKQFNHCNQAQTIIPPRLRFRLPDADQGA